MGPQLAELIAQGSVKLEMRHFPLQQASLSAVEAVECAGEQGYWWAMHDRILSNQGRGVSPSVIHEHAKALGLDTTAFNQCMDSDKYVSFALEKRSEGDKAGVPGTPFFLVNGQPVASYNQVIAAVKKELTQ